MVLPEGRGKFEKINLIGTRSRDLPAYNIVPQPLCSFGGAKTKALFLVS
jgi:hypothetical protein